MTNIRPQSSSGDDRKPAARRDDSRGAILDAAEQIFAERGFVGASIREICRRADVNSGLVAYYFRNKDALFEQVIERRCADFLAMFAGEMAAIDMSRPGQNCARRVLLAYTGFLLRLSVDENWCFYVRLLAKAAAAYDEELVGRLLTRFEPLPDATLAMLIKALPGHDQARIRKGMFYLESALSTIISSSHLLDRRMALKMEDAHEDLVRDIAGFFADRL